MYTYVCITYIHTHIYECIHMYVLHIHIYLNIHISNMYIYISIFLVQSHPIIKSGQKNQISLQRLLNRFDKVNLVFILILK